MQLVQMLLPRLDNAGAPFPHETYRAIAADLTLRFGGVTAYARAPAQGTWQSNDGHTYHDDLIVLEVMVERLDKDWWKKFRVQLEETFRQRELVVRAQSIEVL